MFGIEYTLLTYIVVYFRLEKKIISIEKSDPDPLDRSAEVLPLPGLTLVVRTLRGCETKFSQFFRH